MNEQSQKLIEQLANKLGTTTEYLWGVLIKQAFISSLVQLFQTIAIIFFGFLLYKLHKYLLKQNEVDDKRYTKSIYEDYQEAAVVPMAILFVIYVIVALLAFFSLDNLFAGFFSPEYWALNEILNSLK